MREKKRFREKENLDQRGGANTSDNSERVRKGVFESQSAGQNKQRA